MIFRSVGGIPLHRARLRNKTHSRFAGRRRVRISRLRYSHYTTALPRDPAHVIHVVLGFHSKFSLPSAVACVKTGSKKKLCINIFLVYILYDRWWYTGIYQVHTTQTFGHREPLVRRKKNIYYYNYIIIYIPNNILLLSYRKLNFKIYLLLFRWWRSLVYYIM